MSIGYGVFMIRQLTPLALLISLGLGQSVTHKEITLDSQTLQRYVGAYEVDGDDLVIMLGDCRAAAHALCPRAGNALFLFKYRIRHSGRGAVAGVRRTLHRVRPETYPAPVRHDALGAGAKFRDAAPSGEGLLSDGPEES